MKKRTIIFVSTIWPLFAYALGGIASLGLFGFMYLFGLNTNSSSLLARIIAATASTIVVVMLILGFPMLIKIIKWKKWKVNIGLNGANLKYYLYGIPIVLLFIVLEYAWPSSSATAISSSLNSRTTLELLANIFIAGLCTPIIEELMFRGFMYSGLRQRFGIWFSAIVTSVIFAAMHVDLVFALWLFVFSAVLCWLREKSGSVVPGMVVHGLFNTSLVLIGYLAIFK